MKIFKFLLLIIICTSCSTQIERKCNSEKVKVIKKMRYGSSGYYDCFTIIEIEGHMYIIHKGNITHLESCKCKIKN